MNLPIVTNAENVVKKDLSWLANHLILTGTLVVVLFLGVWEVQNIIEKHDEKKAQQANTALQVVVDQVKRLEDHQAQNDVAIAQRDAARDAIEKALIATINARDKALSDQIQKNATLTAQQAAARLTEEYKAQPGEITASGDTVIADLPLARSFVNTFDQLNTCTLNYADEQKQLSQEQARTADLKTQVSDRDATIKGKDDELVKQKAADAADKKVAVDKEKKKHKWYAVGGILFVEMIKVYFTGKP